jgi:DNA-binding LacI/PurR family transcriptional regulator
MDILVKIHEDGIPIVQVTLPKPTKDIPYVSVDNELGGYLATRHLLELGHRNIVYVTRSEAILKTGTAGMNENYDRYQGYCRALKEQGLLDNVQVMVDPTNGEDKEFILHIIKQKNPPTAVFAYCDDIAIGLIRGAHSNGFKIPDDISVVGFDDLPHAHMFQPPLTTVAQPKYELGTYAAQKLLQLISGKPEKDTILMPLMKIRESTAPFKKSGAGPRNPVVK